MDSTHRSGLTADNRPMLKLLLSKEFATHPDYRATALAGEVPLATVTENAYVLNDGTLCAVFRVKGIEYGMADSEELARFSEGLRSLLNATPVDGQIKFLHRITHNYRALLDEHAQEVRGRNHFARYVAWSAARRTREMMNQDLLTRTENLVVFTYNPKIPIWQQPNPLKYALRLTTNAGVVQRSESEFQRAVLKFESAMRPVVDQMTFCGLKPQRLDDRELYELAWEILNPDISRRHPCPPIHQAGTDDPFVQSFQRADGRRLASERQEVVTILPMQEREILCETDWVFGDGWLRVGKQYVGMLYMRMLPTSVYPSMALAMTQLGFECTISVDAMMLQKAKELSNQWRRARIEKGKAESTLFGAAVDPLKAEAAQAEEEHYKEMSNPSENPMLMRMAIMVTARSVEELDQRCDTIISTFSNLDGLKLVREVYDGVPGLYKTTWPFFPSTTRNSVKALTSQVGDLIPCFDRWEGSKRPVKLLFDPMGGLVKHDPFPLDQPSRNKTITGQTGTGKSFACQIMDVHPHCARDNTEVLIVESLGSFEFSTRCFGGEYVRIGPASKYVINAFDLPPDFDTLTTDQQQEVLQYKFGFIKNLVLSMCRIKDPESSQIAENVVGSVAQRTYATTKQPRFRDFYRMLGEYRNASDEQAEQLAGRLRTLLTNYVVTETGEAGMFSRLFDTFTTFESTKNIICFDLVDVKGDPALLAPLTLVILGGLFYGRLLKRDGKERLIVVDEAWALIKEEADGSLSPAGMAIELFWREGRKLKGASTMISQNISDMGSDKIGRAVLANSLLQDYLKHGRSPANDEALRGQNFSQEKIDRVYSLDTVYGEYSEMVMKRGNQWGMVRIPSGGISYWLSTTDPEDLDVRREYYQKYLESYGLPELAVVALLARDFPGGTKPAIKPPRMTTEEALQYAERWQDHYRRFCAIVDTGEVVPLDFK